jgi:hypothetical protein
LPRDPAERERELWADLDSVLWIANGERGNPFWCEALSSIAEQRRPRWDAELLKIDGVDDVDEVFFSPIFSNLRSVVLAGVVYLRVCPHCDQWFLAKHARTRFCSPTARQRVRPTMKRDRAEYMRRYRQLPQVKNRVTTRKLSGRRSK